MRNWKGEQLVYNITVTRKEHTHEYDNVIFWKWHDYHPVLLEIKLSNGGKHRIPMTENIIDVYIKEVK